jgi:hypothetical protein
MGKLINEKEFRLGDFVFMCRSENTSYGFRHLCTLFRGSNAVGKSKACYYNRTWERYEFESVLSSALKGSSLEGDEFKLVEDFIDSYSEGNPFKGLAMVMRMGDVLMDSRESKIAWKERMAKASGLTLPDDWDELSEDVKEERLNKVMEESKK